MSINVDHELDRLQREFHALPEQVDAARAGALRKTGSWLRTRIKKEVARAHRIPQKSIADRFFVSRVPRSGDRVTVWIGAWNVDPFSVGTPRQTPTGVKVGRRINYRGAFLALIYTAREKVWIRLGSKYFNSDLYPTRHRPGDREALSDPRYKYRFPVVRAGIEISDDVERFIEKYQDDIDDVFIKKMRQELNYQTRVKGILR